MFYLNYTIKHMYLDMEIYYFYCFMVLHFLFKSTNHLGLTFMSDEVKIHLFFQYGCPINRVPFIKKSIISS